MKVVFALLAAGSGRRFGAYKPAVCLNGRPLIYWSLKAIQEQKKWIDRVVLALPPSWTWSRLRAIRSVPEDFPWEPVVVSGGMTRFESLKNCLKALRTAALQDGAPDYLFVHDAARPLWPSSWIRAMLKLLESDPKASGVVPLADVRETIKMVNGSIQTLKERDQLKVSQTPQLVRWDDFEDALSKFSDQKNFLDEVQILELAGRRILPYPGSPFNLKVTFPEDLEMLRGLAGKM
ncbi:MAG: 2-C-methyl-D-erythritol 4-phosphate cytidylyltransferase [Elusimicrobia bacterium]|nr:2-C-methyl-D-erythritol 4-phosphate cytidylyltransferase [Elusimicrobiota bacterium]